MSRYPSQFEELTSKQVKSFVESLKARTPCMDCGLNFPSEAMDFDHARGLKVAGVAMMVNGRFSLDDIREEIDKCDIVCSNCHRIRTRKRSAQKRLTTA